MEDNVYTPPKADLGTNKEKICSPIKAIILATFFDVIGTLLLNLIVGIILGIIIIRFENVAPNEISQRVLEMSNAKYVLLPLSVLGCLITVCCGYLCAKITNYNNYRAVTVYIILTLIIVNLFTDFSDINWIMHIFSTIMSACSALFGGWLFIKNNA